MNRRISVYSQGGVTSATLFYRLYQYFQRMNVDVLYNKQIPDQLYDRVMPLSNKSIWTKSGLFVLIFLRINFFLIRDIICRPDFVIVSRTLLNRWYPMYFNSLLNIIKYRGCTIIWDFDDNITIREIKPKQFLSLSRMASKIIIASPYLKELVHTDFRSKIVLLPTTDGTLNPKYNNEIQENRKQNFKKHINLLWVGTATGLKNVELILPRLDSAAELINKLGKDTILTIVSNGKIEYKTKYLKINNVKWTRNVAENAFIEGHIGLMPLQDSEFRRGKGGFKLIQYLSIGLPSLASNIGINADILSKGGGTLVKDIFSDSWEKEIVRFAFDLEYWEKNSIQAVDNYICNYNFETNLTRWKAIINKE